MTTGSIFILSAASGTGKTSLARALITRLQGLGITAGFSVSHTTRALRGSEQHGIDYHFVTHEQFQNLATEGAFLEHAGVFGKHYGTHVTEVAQRLTQGHDVILDIDWQGAVQVKQQRPDAVSIYLLPPSRAELQRRLTQRGTDSAEAVAKRMAQAAAEMREAVRYDYWIVNDDFERALTQLTAIFVAQRQRKSAQMQAHRALWQELTT